MGVLDMVGQTREDEEHNIEGRLRVAIDSWREALDLERVAMRASNRLHGQVQVSSAIYLIVMPLVKVAFEGDEHVLSAACELLRRYVRTDGWYEPLPLLEDEEDSSLEELEAPQPPQRRAVNPMGSPPRQPQFFADETLDDDDDDDSNYGGDERVVVPETPPRDDDVSDLPLERDTLGSTPTRPPPLVSDAQALPTALVEAAVAATRIAATVAVTTYDRVDYDFYTAVFLGIVERAAQRRSNEAYLIVLGRVISRDFPVDNPLGRDRSVLRMRTREAAIMTALGGLVATASLFDMWTFFDVAMLPDLRLERAVERETLRAMSSILVAFASVDETVASRQPWLTAAGVALLLADVALPRERVMQTTLIEYASLVVRTDRQVEWTIDAAAAAIVRRANYVRASFLDYSQHRFFVLFASLIERERIVSDDGRRLERVERSELDVQALIGRFTRVEYFSLPPLPPPTLPETPAGKMVTPPPGKRRRALNEAQPDVRRSLAAPLPFSRRPHSKSNWSEVATLLFGGGDIDAAAAENPLVV